MTRERSHWIQHVNFSDGSKNCLSISWMRQQFDSRLCVAFAHPVDPYPSLAAKQKTAALQSGPWTHGNRKVFWNNHKNESSAIISA